MVEDVPPYWIYLPRNLSYVGDQVWDYFICCKRRNQGRMSVEWNHDDCVEEILTPENPLLTESEELVDTPRDELIEKEGICDILDGLKLDDQGDGDSGLTNSVSDDSDVTIADRLGDFTPVLNIERDDDLRSDISSDAFVDDDCQNGVPEVAELLVKSSTVNMKDVKYRSEMALNLFKDREDGKRMSFLDLLAPNDDENDEFPEPELRRSTSLKTTKTPPGTPRRKKAVRFADAFGLDLEHVRHVLNLDSPPRIPVSAVKDLRSGIEKEHITEGTKYLHALFDQPGADNLFIQRVLTQKVCLENAMINDLSITGMIRVANISFHKTVYVRYTTNEWDACTNVVASYVLNSCDGATDRFSFTLCSDREMDVGSRLQFAVCYEAAGCQYWDNNNGQNYIFECYAKSVPALSSDNAWLHFL